MQSKFNQLAGFTLIELLVVIAIIGLLASVVLLALNSARMKSRDTKRVADIRQIITSLELYYNDCASYPVVAAPLTLGPGKGVYGGSSANCGTNGGTATNGGIGTTPSGNVYLGSMPLAPVPSDGVCPTAGPGSTDANPYKYTSTDASGTAVTTAPAAGYSITFCTGGPTGNLASGFHTATPSAMQ